MNYTLPFRDGNLPYLVRRSENVRIGYHNYYRPGRGYFFPNWYCDWYYYEPIINRSCFSPFYFYVFLPAYIPLTRVVYISQPRVVYVETPYYGYNNDDYYLNRRNDALSNAISDIRRAWQDGDYGLYSRHLYRDGKISVFLDGRYAYSLTANDYADLSRDAIETVYTERFTIDSVKQRNNGQVVLYGTHTYQLDNNDSRRVYVSFTLERSDGEWFIIEVGSSTTKRLGN